METGIYTTDVFLERTKYLTEKIKTIKKNIEHIENEINRINKMNESKVNIVPKVQSVLDTYHNQDIPGKNILLKSILEKVVYLKTEKRYKSKIDKFELKVYPKTAQTED